MARQSRRNLPNLDSVSSINPDGSRRFIRPAHVSGRFTRARTIVGLILLLITVILPWIDIGGYPAVLLDIPHRRFHLFGITLIAQDLWLSFFILSGLGFLLFVVTSLWGRIWCGWTCPHSLLLEQIFRPIERLVEGDSARQRALDDAPWTSSKVMRRGLKHALYIIVSLSLAHVFLSYFVPVEVIGKWILSNPSEHWDSFLLVATLTGLFYFNFSWFREQLCIVICPYGRVQSALIDDDSLIIGYDTTRGEPRGKPSDPANGHCIDCLRCVNVCPMGIDIRMGLQIECIGCAYCIDACDQVMDKLRRPRGLIRYDSLNGFAGKRRKLLRPRTFLYAGFLLVGSIVMTLSLFQLKPFHLSVTRMSGPPFHRTETAVRNQFSVRLLNKTGQETALTIRADSGAITQMSLNDPVPLKPYEETVLPLIVSVPATEFRAPFEFHLTLSRPDGTIVSSRDLRFLGPDLQASQRELVFD